MSLSNWKLVLPDNGLWVTSGSLLFVKWCKKEDIELVRGTLDPHGIQASFAELKRTWKVAPGQVHPTPVPLRRYP